MKDMIKDALILCAITLVAGLLLGFVYELTEDSREEQKIIKQNEAYKAVVSDAETFEELDVDTEKLYENAKVVADLSEKEVVIDKCLVAKKKNGELAGYIVSVTSKEGYGGNISMTVGMDIKGNVIGVSVTSISETAGLGMKAKEDDFLNRYKVVFENSEYEPYVVNGDGNSGIDAISGATITTNAMTKGVNMARVTGIYIRDNVEIETLTEGGEVSE